ncbi:signal peptidase II [Curtobacterium sp. PhB130]|uniref:signal peptidase II n=1 Tax=unclassified Curtobacterium TaxID=257496 RepID=UPI000FBF16DF|nr:MULTISPECIES: signal peptidase II [unclassified Curtobacterium]ROP65756.1 signal peptidase II [Curtobacterium sp. ZW137]ROS72289.1 signal peptidase II [Curtobacterium sp. PhB130]TCK63008.1 signal peptidase II [Curtobacterium sp. PhB136]
MSQQDQRAKVSVRAIAALAFAAVVVVAADQIVKALVVANLPYGQVVPVLGNALQFLYVRNPGAAFSFAVNMTWVFSIVSAAVVVAIIVFARRIHSMWWAIVLGMLLGGALGNLSDRLFREPGFGQGHVVDFISTPWMMPAIYNIADSFICVSMVIFVLLVIFGVNLDGTRTVSDKRKGKGGLEARGDSATDAAATATPSVASTDAADAPRASSRPHGDQRDSLGHDAT